MDNILKKYGLTVEDIENYSRIVARTPDKVSQLATEELTAQEVMNATEDTIREYIKEMSYDDGVLSINKFNQHKHEFFQVLEQVLSPVVNEKVYEIVDEVAEVKSAVYGEENVFTTPDEGLFKTTVVSDGNWNIVRQRADRGTYSPDLERVAVKIYEEIDSFTKNRTDWGKLIDKVAESIARDIYVRALRSMTSALDSTTASGAGAGAFDEKTFTDTLISVHRQTGMKPKIYGTTEALSKIETDKESPTMREEKSRDFGYYGKYKGYDIVEIPFDAVKGDEQSKSLFIVPEGNTDNGKPLKIYIDSANNTVYDITDPSRRLDEQVEYFMAQRAGSVFFRPAYYAVVTVE